MAKCDYLYNIKVSQNHPSGPFGDFFVLRHPSHLLLVSVDNTRNVTITQRFRAAPDQESRDFSWYTDCIFQLQVHFYIYARATNIYTSSEFRRLREIPAGQNIS